MSTTLRKVQLTAIAFIVLAVLSTPQSTFGQSDGALAKLAQNPIANIYSFPFQNNTNWNVGPFERPFNVLNIQPVIPIPLSDKVNLINRIIIPVISVPSFTEDANSSGVGDVLYTALFSPAKPSKVLWGAGPAIQLPTSSGDEFGSGEFGIGPSVVVLTMQKEWVLGALVNNVWTMGDVEENKFLLNPFVNYNFPKWYLTSGPIITADWNVDQDQRWVVPVGGGIGKIFKLGGKLPLNTSIHFYYNAIKPDYLGDFQTRFQLQIMLPSKRLREQLKQGQ